MVSREMDKVMDIRALAKAQRKRKGSWWAQLWVQVLIAVALGAILGIVYPNIATDMKPLGDGFIKAIRMIIGPIIFTIVVVGIAKMGDMKAVARIGWRALIYFEAVTAIALTLGLLAGNLWPTGAGINANPASLDIKAVAAFVTHSGTHTVSAFLLDIIPSTFVGAFTQGQILPILFISLLFGLGLCAMGERAKPVINILDGVMTGLFQVVKFIMYFAPLGAFGAIAFTIGKFGIGTLLGLGKLVLAVYAVNIFFVVVILGIFIKLSGLPFWKTLSFFKDEMLFVFFATSFEAMLPRCMQKLERLGCTEEAVGLIMPAGMTFNMDASAIYMSMSVLFIAQATNIHLGWEQQLTILGVMLFTSMGAGGVAGAGFVALAATLPAVPIIPIGGLALLLGVDRFMSQIRALVNLTSDVLGTLVIARWAGALDMEKARRVLAGLEEEAIVPATVSGEPGGGAGFAGSAVANS
jgi:aerobic C4-dicarboxylate transport protein